NRSSAARFRAPCQGRVGHVRHTGILAGARPSPGLIPMHKLDPRRGLDSFRRIQRGGNLGASPPTLLAAGFLALIALGTVLLALPIAGGPERLSLFEAFFTATASVTVTGLTIVTPQQLSLFGQWVSIILVQIGGLGF